MEFIYYWSHVTPNNKSMGKSLTTVDANTVMVANMPNSPPQRGGRPRPRPVARPVYKPPVHKYVPYHQRYYTGMHEWGCNYCPNDDYVLGSNTDNEVVLLTDAVDEVKTNEVKIKRLPTPSATFKELPAPTTATFQEEVAQEEGKNVLIAAQIGTQTWEVETEEGTTTDGAKDAVVPIVPNMEMYQHYKLEEMFCEKIKDAGSIALNKVKECSISFEYN